MTVMATCNARILVHPTLKMKAKINVFFGIRLGLGLIDWIPFCVLARRGYFKDERLSN
jgi:hypothetical protein